MRADELLDGLRILEPISGGGALRMTLVELADDPHARLRGERLSPPPLIDLQAGTRVGDVVWVAGGLTLVSGRVREALSPFTGWTTFPFELTTRAAPLTEPLADHRVLAVTGRAARVDLARSDRVMSPPPVPRGRAMEVLRGIHFEGDGWDGSDVFLASGWGVVFVVREAAEALRGAKGLRLELAADYEVPAWEFDE